MRRRQGDDPRRCRCPTKHGALDQAGDLTDETKLRLPDAGKPARWPVEISFVIAPLILLVMANPDDKI
jgi:hypothetical protein